MRLMDTKQQCAISMSVYVTMSLPGSLSVSLFVFLYLCPSLFISVSCQFLYAAMIFMSNMAIVLSLRKAPMRCVET
jgi:hypothetical protein